MDPNQPAEPKISAEEFAALALEGVPYAGQLNCRFERFEAGKLTVRMPYQPLLRRPGNTICGPALMALADITLYGVVMSMIGRVELAVTTDLTIHFLRRPAPADVLAEGRLLKLGRRLAIGEVTMHGERDPGPICHVVGTYAIPP
ncbi:MAG: PaaI family thioesterase [Pseudomonadota bacterium]